MTLYGSSQACLVLNPWLLASLFIDEVSYVESSESYSLGIVASHLLLISCYSLGCFNSDFVQAVQVCFYFFIVTFYFKKFPSHAGDTYFNWYDFFHAVSESEWCFSCWVLAVVRYTHKTFGNSSGHAPFGPSSRVLMIFSNVWLVTFVCPFSWGCPSDENWFLMLRFEQNDLNPWLSNCRLMLEIILGMPNLQLCFFTWSFVPWLSLWFPGLLLPPIL